MRLRFLDAVVAQLTAAVVVANLRGVPGIRQFQVVQTALDEFNVYVIPGAEFTAAHRDCVLQRLQRQFGADTRLHYRVVASIYRPPGVKFPSVVSLERLEAMRRSGQDVSRFLRTE